LEATILIIEDDPLAAKILERQLSHDRYRVLTAYNGLQGLKMCRENPPDLVLLDLMLPGVDGFEVLSQLRADPRTADVPVVIVSAKTDYTDREMATRLGATAYLTKPFKWAELLETVHSLLQQAPRRGTAAGKGILLIGARGWEAAWVGPRLGSALARRGEATALVDFRPFSVEHFLVLEVTPPQEPISLAGVGTDASLSAALVRHPSGLHLLGNLQGGGAAGELRPDDVSFVLDMLLREMDYVLADLPLYPVEVLRRAAERAELTLLIFRDDAPSLAAARSALRLMENAGLNMEHVYLLPVGPLSERGVTEFDRPVLGVVLGEAEAAERIYEILADRVAALVGSSDRGGVSDAG